VRAWRKNLPPITQNLDQVLHLLAEHLWLVRMLKLVEAADLGAIYVFVELVSFGDESTLLFSNHFFVLVIKVIETLRLVVVLQITSVQHPSILIKNFGVIFVTLSAELSVCNPALLR
jgi:hypothetical protein